MFMKIMSFVIAMLNWALATPAKQTIKPVSKVLQFAICYGIIAYVGYYGYKFYNESKIWDKIPKVSVQWSQPAETESAEVETAAAE